MYNAAPENSAAANVAMSWSIWSMDGLFQPLGTPYSSPVYRCASEAQLAQLVFEIADRTPGKNLGVSALVGRVLLQPIRPSAATRQWQKRPMVQPCQADF